MSFRTIVRNPVQMIGGELCIMNKISPRTSFEMTRGGGAENIVIRCFTMFSMTGCENQHAYLLLSPDFPTTDFLDLILPLHYAIAPANINA
jgi:polygalacturonase